MGLADEKERKDEARRLLEWGVRSRLQGQAIRCRRDHRQRAHLGRENILRAALGPDGDLEVVLAALSPSPKAQGRDRLTRAIEPPVKEIRWPSSVSPAWLRTALEALATGETPLYATEDVAPAASCGRVDSLLRLAIGPSDFGLLHR